MEPSILGRNSQISNAIDHSPAIDGRDFAAAVMIEEQIALVDPQRS
jgi:hypothetical protein